nr:hypothetical protein [uncultured Flavobacterium sp.]
MGFTILPICTNCGYKTKSIAIGGGRFNHLTICFGPVLNTESNEIEQINLYDYAKKVIVKNDFITYESIEIEITNENYVPYYESSMFINDSEIRSYNWNNKNYKQSKNFCPKCKTYNLDFLLGVLFD